LEETITRLSRVGFDNVIGYLEGGIEAWKAAGKETDSVTTIPAVEWEKELDSIENPSVVDVRKHSEYEAEHLEGAENYPLSDLNNHLAAIPSDQTVFVHCAGGYRSMIASSILKSRGIHNIVDIAGGFGAIKKTSLKTTAFVCPSTLA
jgi:rhodanese-related sulfurtransferase